MVRIALSATSGETGEAAGSGVGLGSAVVCGMGCGVAVGPGVALNVGSGSGTGAVAEDCDEAGLAGSLPDRPVDVSVPAHDEMVNIALARKTLPNSRYL